MVVARRLLPIKLDDFFFFESIKLDNLKLFVVNFLALLEGKVFFVTIWKHNYITFIYIYIYIYINLKLLVAKNDRRILLGQHSKN